MSEKKDHLIKLTADGTPTIYSAIYGTEYHSRHGALNESRCVFIQAGLKHLLQKSGTTAIHLLEYGFGTGLNAFLTAKEMPQDISISYTALELHPLSSEIYTTYAANLKKLLQAEEDRKLFLQLHQSEWEEWQQIRKGFRIKKLKTDFRDFSSQESLDLVYYDAFGPGTQAELWSAEIFEKIYRSMNPGAVLVTFCVQGAFRRMLTELGYEWEKLPGPPGKREMLRAFKK